ncbi:oxidoreductase-like domain-containing protein [Roseateles chitosanitabidus]|jgi:hypothetical protein|uniref:oxidoreductase-like domain-containing protein n=1 Tax=Roseateles chitosanitabidus TaxID=65048 RepID=UPI00082DDC0B
MTAPTEATSQVAALVATDAPGSTSSSGGAVDDPMPVPPQQPDIDACCGNGCDPCIFDLHDLAMDQYRQDLRAWKARHPEAPA